MPRQHRTFVILPEKIRFQWCRCWWRHNVRWQSAIGKWFCASHTSTNAKPEGYTATLPHMLTSRAFTSTQIDFNSIYRPNSKSFQFWCFPSMHWIWSWIRCTEHTRTITQKKRRSWRRDVKNGLVWIISCVLIDCIISKKKKKKWSVCDNGIESYSGWKTKIWESNRKKWIVRDQGSTVDRWTNERTPKAIVTKVVITYRKNSHGLMDYHFRSEYVFISFQFFFVTVILPNTE